MAKYNLAFTDQALNHITKIATFHLQKVGPNSAQNITDRLVDGFQILENQPFAGGEHPDIVLAKQGYRRLILDNYVGVYRIVDDTVLVYGIYHGSTNYTALFK